MPCLQHAKRDQDADCARIPAPPRSWARKPIATMDLTARRGCRIKLNEW